jgi:hypothetical protein
MTVDVALTWLRLSRRFRPAAAPATRNRDIGAELEPGLAKILR